MIGQTPCMVDLTSYRSWNFMISRFARTQSQWARSCSMDRSGPSVLGCSSRLAGVRQTCGRIMVKRKVLKDNIGLHKWWFCCCSSRNTWNMAFYFSSPSRTSLLAWWWRWLGMYINHFWSPQVWQVSTNPIISKHSGELMLQIPIKFSGTLESHPFWTVL